jgi:selenocysteine lyase/cysteine desulfurase
MHAQSLLQLWRQDTPGTATVTHLNNAGAGLMPEPVLAAIQLHLELESAAGGYEAAAIKAKEVEQVYGSLARLISASPRNIAVVENATVAFWQALAAFDLAPGDRIVTTLNDYASHQITYLALKQRRGIDVAWAKELPEGGADPDDFRKLLRHPRSRLATICWIPTSSGLIQDVKTLVALANEAGVPSIVDACQAVGQVPIDCSDLNCDFLGGTGRKFLRGPRGIGFLYVSDRVLEAGRYPINIDGRGATWTDVERFTLPPTAQRFENWEFPYALVLGLGRAAEYAMAVGVEEGSNRALALGAIVRERLSSIPGLTILDRGAAKGAIATAGIAGWDANRMVDELRKRKINTSAATRSWALLDFDRKQVETALRVSPHYYNTEGEIEALVEAVTDLIPS